MFRSSLGDWPATCPNPIRYCKVEGEDNVVLEHPNPQATRKNKLLDTQINSFSRSLSSFNPSKRKPFSLDVGVIYIYMTPKSHGGVKGENLQTLKGELIP